MSTGEAPAQRVTRWLAVLLVVAVVYLLSSGPVLGIGFALRRATGRDEFNNIMWLYYPLLDGPAAPLFGWYIQLWVIDVFHTSGPGTGPM